MKVVVCVRRVSKLTDEVGFEYHEVVEITPPEENFIRSQNDIANAITRLMPNIFTSTSFDYYRLEVIVEKVND